MAAEEVPIKFHSTIDALKMMGKYKGPADAAKEPTSNDLDEFLNPKNVARVRELQGICRVTYTITKDKLIYEGPFAMPRPRFKEVVQKVCGSIKKGLSFAQIGRQAIGMWFWLHVFNAKMCVIFSKAAKGDSTLKVTARHDKENVKFETAKKHESLKKPGMKYVVSGFDYPDLTRASCPLHPKRFSTFLGSKFRDYIRDGLLEIEIKCKSKTYRVEPVQIDLPSITEDHSEIHVRGDSKRIIKLELYFDSSGKGAVAIRHMKVPNIDDIKEIGDVGLGLENSFLTSGFVAGNIDADFLEPIAGKTGFKADINWQEFLVEMSKLIPEIEAKVQLLKQAEEEKKLQAVFKEADEIARHICNSLSCFAALESLAGERRSSEPAFPKGGFNFVPSTIRITPRHEGHIIFKACVSTDPDKLSFVNDGGTVFFKINNPDITISPKSAILRESKGQTVNDENVVSVRVTLKSNKMTKQPAVLTATHGIEETQAKITFAKKKEQKGPPRTSIGSIMNYEEVRFTEGPEKHSRLVGKTIQINTLNPDYLRAVSGSHRDMLVYVVKLRLKETLVNNNSHLDGGIEMYLSGAFAAEHISGKVLSNSKKKSKKK